MRPTKVAIAEALRSDEQRDPHWSRPHRFSRSNAPRLPTLPAVEVIGLSSERVGDGPMVRHELSIEVTGLARVRGRGR